MKEETIFRLPSLYRDDFRVKAYTFGDGSNDVAVVGAMRGNEYQQLYTASKLIQRLKELELKNRIIKGHSITVIPCVNPSSMNIHKRFWPIDNTDINRMFPGYDRGETTQRIAAALFDRVKDSRYGIQFASFYMPGSFVPHVRMMKTGYEDLILAKQFGLPYVILHAPRPFDTATLNYNWQIWGTKAFSIYTTSTAEIDHDSSKQAIEAILNFLSKEGIIRYTGREGYISRVVETGDLITLRALKSGFLEPLRKGGEYAEKGEVLARILDTYTSEVLSEITSPVDGVIEFSSNEPITYENTTIFKLIRDED